jgi:hypothetical protein
MKLTIRRKGSLRRTSLVDECARLRKENAWLTRKVRELDVEAALARSSSNEWRDRYNNLRQTTPVGWMQS